MNIGAALPQQRSRKLQTWANLKNIGSTSAAMRICFTNGGLYARKGGRRK